MAFCTHCFMWPLLLPFLEHIFAQTILASNLHWFTFGVTTMLSVSLGALMTAKIQSQNFIRDFPGENLAAPLTNHHNENSSLDQEISLLFLYQNKPAQDKKCEEIKAGNLHFKKQRARLH